MGSSEYKSKEDRKRTKRNPSDPMYSTNPSKSQVEPRPKDDRRGAARDACHVERRSFERLTSAKGSGRSVSRQP